MNEGPNQAPNQAMSSCNNLSIMNRLMSAEIESIAHFSSHTLVPADESRGQDSEKLQAVTSIALYRKKLRDMVLRCTKPAVVVRG